MSLLKYPERRDFVTPRSYYEAQARWFEADGRRYRGWLRWRLRHLARWCPRCGDVWFETRAPGAFVGICDLCVWGERRIHSRSIVGFLLHDIRKEAERVKRGVQTDWWSRRDLPPGFGFLTRMVEQELDKKSPPRRYFVVKRGWASEVDDVLPMLPHEVLERHPWPQTSAAWKWINGDTSRLTDHEPAAVCRGEVTEVNRCRQ